MPIFYRGPGANITHEVFQVLSPVSRSFAIRELRRIHIVQTQDDSPGTGARAVTASAVGLSAVALVVLVTAGQFAGPSMWTVLVMLAVGVSATVSTGCWRTGPQPYELRAIYRGQRVCLLRTADERLLGQVSRALLRAVECADARIDGPV